MVALNESFAPGKPALGSKNRVGNFFEQEAKSSRMNRLSGQWPRRENGCGYDETASGMFFYGFRYYDPVTGRWPSRDPYEKTEDINRYAFSLNNPISYWDYLGLSTDKYVPDNSGKHGGPHVDRYNKAGQNVGRYRKDGTPMTFKGKPSPAIPNSDKKKFKKASGKVKNGGLTHTTGDEALLVLAAAGALTPSDADADTDDDVSDSITCDLSGTTQTSSKTICNYNCSDGTSGSVTHSKGKDDCFTCPGTASPGDF